MKRIATLMLLLGLTGILGCEPKKPEKVKSDAPMATPAADETMPPADAGGEKPAEGTEKPADEPAK